MEDLEKEEFETIGKHFYAQVRNLHKYIHKCNGLKQEEKQEVDKQIANLKEENQHALDEAKAKAAEANALVAKANEEVVAAKKETVKAEAINAIYKSMVSYLEEKSNADKEFSATDNKSRENGATQEIKDKHLANQQRLSDANNMLEEKKRELAKLLAQPAVPSMEGGARKKKKTAEQKSSKGKRRSNSKSKGKGRKNSKPSKK